MSPTLCILGGCNGAGKTTLARELLPRLGIPRFLNADEIAKGLSPLDPNLSAFRAGRILLEEAATLMKAGASFAIESTLSGRTHVRLLQRARAMGYRVVLHYVMIESASQAVQRVRLRVLQGGHHVPEEDIRRRFQRSRKGVIRHYLPLADEWGVWDNSTPPPRKFADSRTQTPEQLLAMLKSSNLMEEPIREESEMTRIVLEAGRVATEKMLDYYRRMDIKVTPQMTLLEDEESPAEA